MTFHDYLIDYYALIRRITPMARRPMPPSKVISSTADDPKLPRKGETRSTKRKPYADELNAQSPQHRKKKD